MERCTPPSNLTNVVKGNSGDGSGALFPFAEARSCSLQTSVAKQGGHKEDGMSSHRGGTQQMPLRGFPPLPGAPGTFE